MNDNEYFFLLIYFICGYFHKNNKAWAWATFSVNASYLLVYSSNISLPLFAETPASAAQKIYFKDMKVHDKAPSEIKITWEKYNLTANDAANIRISLWGYRETTIRPTLLYITGEFCV